LEAIDTSISPGFGEPYILRPTIGDVPLLDLLRECPFYQLPGGMVRSTVIWLQVGPNDYVSYSLEGGP
jgi:hypothetical protein